MVDEFYQIRGLERATPSLDYGIQKVNSNDVSAAYQRHLLHGSRWALGRVGTDSKP